MKAISGGENVLLGMVQDDCAFRTLMVATDFAGWWFLVPHNSGIVGR
jgi:hypothetical protein